MKIALTFAVPLYRGIEQLVARRAQVIARLANNMDTKLKGDIAEQAVILHALQQGWGVLKPIGDRLPYDLALDISGKLIKFK